ncbi:RagB/SusD family nutrient uptake outer membrane protein [Chitinophaga japonensis]|nr:RagB/SusD family nutrient uptake outer membrane protein [Chitinophaga japonensis]
MLAFTGCKKFLEQPPDNRAELNSPEQVSQLLGTAYPQANYMAFFESISDNVADKGAGSVERTSRDPFFFEDVQDDQQDSPEFYWNACYAAIAAANQALEVCDNAADRSAYSAQRGEALVARAYAHFMLVNVFSKVYDPASAGSDPGIPYVTEPEKVVFKPYERRTVSYVYEMIEQDITEGLPLIDDRQYTVPKYHFTRAAAHAFAARFYLFKRDYAKVVEHANQVFAAGNVSGLLRPWNTTYLSITYNELFARYARATEPANLLLVETASWWARQYYTIRYAMNAAKRNEILGANVTGGEWAFRYQLFTAGTDNYLIPKINEHFVRSSVNANIGVGYVVVPLLTAEEVLFNRIEAYAYLNNTNAAIADLNTYAATRINNYDAGLHTITATRIRNFYGVSNLQTGILATLFAFKRAEYVQEGMRWLDLLRYKAPVIHVTADGQVLELREDDPRRVFQLPQSVTESGLELNPR